MSSLVVRGPCSIEGHVAVPGDKSISHRALMLAAVANGPTQVHNLGPGQDVGSTIDCLQSYGVTIERSNGDAVVRGKGMRSWVPPETVLDCGNSGTTMRLLAGFATHYEARSEFDGDASLRVRPMQRLVGPLSALGARITTTDGHPPLRVEGGRLEGTDISTEVPSAQVKSAALFAALAADGKTTVTEPAESRNHTECLLTALGAPMTDTRLPEGGHRIELMAFSPPRFELDVPGDVSSAAFLVCAAVLCGAVRIEGVGLNLTRIAYIGLLSTMGAHVVAKRVQSVLGEPVGTIDARRSDLTGITIDGDDPRIQDELPVLAVAATQATGTTTVRGAGELRVKESDRITTLVSGLRSLGADIEELADGFVINGPTPLTGAAVTSAGDHRIAMALTVAGLVADGETVVDGFESAGVSWPGFENVLTALGAKVALQS